MVEGFIILVVLYVLRNIFGGALHFASFKRLTVEQSRSIIEIIGALVAIAFILFFFLVLWKFGILGAMGNAVGEVFSSFWTVLKLLPRLLTD